MDKPLLTNKLLTRKQAAEILGVKEGTLAVWLSTKRYPLKYKKIGSCVRYLESDLYEFIEQNTLVHQGGNDE